LRCLAVLPRTRWHTDVIEVVRGPLMSEQARDAPDSSPYVDAISVELTGEVDIASADEAQAELDRAIWAAPHSEVVVGLAGVTFMDCCGLSVLLRARKSLGARLILRSPSQPVTRLLDLTNLRDAFRMVDGQA
jgi:anti-anti-sigma factor